ncbi:hypothetical protein ACFXTO_033009 [Malus domestica]
MHTIVASLEGASFYQILVPRWPRRPTSSECQPPFETAELVMQQWSPSLRLRQRKREITFRRGVGGANSNFSLGSSRPIGGW